jgi:hypothetical protein
MRTARPVIAAAVAFRHVCRRLITSSRIVASSVKDITRAPAKKWCADCDHTGEFRVSFASGFSPHVINPKSLPFCSRLHDAECGPSAVLRQGEAGVGQQALEHAW